MQEQIDNLNISPVNKKIIRHSKDDEYFKKAFERKYNLYDKLIKERQIKDDKIKYFHKQNLINIKLDKSKMKKAISTPNLFPSKSMLTIEEEKKILKQKYHDLIFGKTKEYLEKYEKKLSNIKLISSMKKEPEPYFIDIREKILNPKKGKRILGKYPSQEKIDVWPKYRKIKDEFDKIAEKSSNFKPHYSERFPSTEKINLQKEKEIKFHEEIEKKEEEKREKRQKNRENSQRSQMIQKMKNERKEKFEIHKELLKKEENQLESIRALKREISIQKGYGDPEIIRPIDYSQVEESPPKYSIKGRYDNKDFKENSFFNFDFDRQVDLIEEKMKEPLPNFNYIKPKLPSIVFNKAERFPKQRNAYEDSVILFENGIFRPQTHIDFSTIEPMKTNADRSYNRLPNVDKGLSSPGDYLFKSNFDLIAEKGEKISKIRNKIRKKQNEEKKVNKI